MLVDQRNMEPLVFSEPVPGAKAAEAALPQGTSAAPSPRAMKLVINGFGEMERRLLNGTILLSKRRQPMLELLSLTECSQADVVMIDGTDQEAVKWATDQTWLKDKAVIWVDAAAAAQAHISVKRPVTWPNLPMLLARALERSAEKNSNHVVSVALPSTSSNSVLVVDDSLAVRAYLRSLLEPRGYKVTDADSAEVGIAAAAATTYACILMDVLMPGIDGYEACRRIKARARNGNAPPIVMLTSKSSPFDRIRGKMAGCDAYLTKPVAVDHLHEVLSRWTTRTTGSSAATPRGLNVAPQRI